MTKKIYIRADGSKKIGMGHLNRSAILASYFKQTWNIDTLLITQKNEAATKFMANRGVRFMHIQPTSTMAEEIDQLHSLSQILAQPDLFIIDVLEYDIHSDYTKSLRAFKAPLIAITDDSAKRIISADLIINGNPYQLDHEYNDNEGYYLIGPDYFIMDSEYANLRVSPPRKKINKILISVGGSDHNNILFTIIDAIENIGEFSLRIISSKSTGYLDKLQDYLGLLRNKTELLVDLPSLKDSWSDCDIAITAGGNTLFERIATGIPGCTVCQLVRQNEISTRFEELGVNVNLGLSSRITKQQLQYDIAKFILNHENHLEQHLRSRQYVDGKGMKRVGEALYSLL